MPRKKKGLKQRKELARIPDEELFFVDTEPQDPSVIESSGDAQRDSSGLEKSVQRTAPVQNAMSESDAEPSASHVEGLWSPLQPHEYYESSDDELLASSGGNRYYPKRDAYTMHLVCNVCLQRGHNTRDCEHRVCLACGRVDRKHETRECPLLISCFRCGSLGHAAQTCRVPIAHGRCRRCSSHLHPTWKCWSRWRLYRTFTQRRTAGVSLSCANCGRRGHMFDNCPKLSTMHASRGRLDYSSFNYVVLDPKCPVNPRDNRGTPFVAAVRKIDAEEGKTENGAKREKKRAYVDLTNDAQEPPSNASNTGPRFKASYMDVQEVHPRQEVTNSSSEHAPEPKKTNLFKALGFEPEYYKKGRPSKKQKK